MRPRLFVTRALALDPREVLGEEIEVDVFEHARPPTPAELAARGRGCDGLVTLLSDRIDAALLGALPRLRVVANHAVGFDNVDVPSCTQRGVWVTHTPDVLTDATADLTWALLLAAARRLREGERWVREGRFDCWSPTLLLGLELRGRTLGLFGHGRIGAAVGRRAAGFGMQVLHCARTSGVPFAELLERADVVSIHAPLSPSTRHAFDDAAFARMRPGAILVNTARGPIVDEAALVRALESGRLRAAGLDVYEDEPHVHPGLVGRDDVVLLPHVGSATDDARRAMATLALRNAQAVLRGGRPPDPVNEPQDPPRG